MIIFIDQLLVPAIPFHENTKFVESHRKTSELCITCQASIGSNTKESTRILVSFSLPLPSRVSSFDQLTYINGKINDTFFQTKEYNCLLDQCN